MTRCEEFYEKWKRDPNWCEKCDTSVYYINRYLELCQRFPALKPLSERALRPLMVKRAIPKIREVAWVLEKRLKLGFKLDAKDVAAILDYMLAGGSTTTATTIQDVATLKTEFTMVKKEAQKQPIPTVEKRVIQAATWKERMAPVVSRMDEEVYGELQKRGINGLFQEQIPIGFARPDIILDKRGKAVAVFLDGPVHEGREDRDQAARQRLASRGITILEFTYGEYSSSQRDWIVNQITEHMKGPK